MPAESSRSAIPPDQWRVLEPLLDRALGENPERRAALLQSLCGEHTEIRDQLAGLLQECEGSTTLLEAPAAERFAALFSYEADAHALLGDRYRIERELGAGGMATVYLADDTRHARKVAVKLLSADVSAVVARQRFLSEIRIVSQLAHPHILGLHDSGESDGCVFYVMPYVDGESLRDRLRRCGTLRVAEALQIAREVLDALAYAHARGIVHRDIKPENILFEAGHAVLCDFGIAQALTTAVGGSLTGVDVLFGTPTYMSPEQAQPNTRIDARSDLFSLGCVMYEMLAGEPPARSAPHGLHSFRPRIPEDLQQVIMRCLQQDPAARYASADEVLHALASCEAQATVLNADLRVLFRRKSVARVALAIIVIAAAIATWVRVRQSHVHWARAEAPGEAKQLIASGLVYGAYDVLRRAERYLPDDPIIQELLGQSTNRLRIQSTPPGANIFVRDVLADSSTWRFVGRTPLDSMQFPLGTLAWKATLPGYRSQQRLDWTIRRIIRMSLIDSASAPSDMAFVRGGPMELFSTDAVQLDDYWVDKHEVTNRQFKMFMHDSAGYERPRYWTHVVAGADDGMTQRRAQQLFRDKTGRPGPATWHMGTYPSNQADHPVGGVSWYEAVAYCAAFGKQLPTIYHWYNAADFTVMTEYVAFSNYASSGPQKVGNPRALGTNGTYDMAGNVKEWAWNEASDGRRYLLGGGFNEPSYMFWDPDAQRAEKRDPDYGFRCGRFSSPPSASLTNGVVAPNRDYRKERPASDEVYAVLAGLFDYEPSPIDAKVESTDDAHSDWRIEHVSYAASYGRERVPAVLYIPKRVSPPYQTVVWMPGAAAFFVPRPLGNGEGQQQYFQFLVRSGRAVLFPAYKGSYERSIGSILQRDVWNDVVIHASKDLRRGLDYLATRPDIDTAKLAFMGFSMGAGLGPIVTAVEPRFKASILFSGGLYAFRRRPEAEAFNFLPRVRVPTLMINGRHDLSFPVDLSQEPMFNLLGTPPENKRHVVLPSGHFPIERDSVTKESLRWLDRYLGSVADTRREAAGQARRRPAVPSALAAYQRGLYHLNRRTGEGRSRALAELQEAVRLDSLFAEAYASLADAYLYLGYLGYPGAPPAPVAFANARVAVEKALALDSSLAEAHLTLARLGWMYDPDLAGAQRAAETALTLNRGLADAHFELARILSLRGDSAGAIASASRALELDPLTSARHADVAWVYWLVRRFDQAIRTAMDAIALDSMGSTGYLALGGAQAAKGQYADAVATYKRGLASSGGNRVFLPQLGYVYARAGQSTEARDILRQLHELYRAQLVSPYYVAQVYLGLGARDSALTWLEKTQKERWGHLAFIRANAVWDPLRSEPRFQRLMEQLELRVHHN